MSLESVADAHADYATPLLEQIEYLSSEKIQLLQTKGAGRDEALGMKMSLCKKFSVRAGGYPGFPKLSVRIWGRRPLLKPCGKSQPRLLQFFTSFSCSQRRP